MRVQMRAYGRGTDFDDGETTTLDEEIEELTRPLHGLAPILEVEDDDFEDFDTSEYVGRTYQ